MENNRVISVEKYLNSEFVQALTAQIETTSITSSTGAKSRSMSPKMIAEYSGQTACDIQPCHSNEFSSPVTRPSYSVLDKTKIKETFGIKVPYWTESLKKCISNLKKQLM